MWPHEASDPKAETPALLEKHASHDSIAVDKQGFLACSASNSSDASRNSLRGHLFQMISVDRQLFSQALGVRGGRWQ